MHKKFEQMGRKIALLLALSMAPLLANANLVVNGNFASGGAGWAFNYGPLNHPPAVPFDCGVDCGFHSIQVEGQTGWFDPWDLCQCTISQTLQTTAGQLYRVSYRFGIQSALESAGFFEAWFDDFIGQSTHAPFYGLPGAPWQLSEMTFFVKARSDASTLEFGGMCPGCNFFVANVNVEAVPEPSSLPLVFIGLATALLITYLKRPWRFQLLPR
jgi:hypothetical protein